MTTASHRTASFAGNVIEAVISGFQRATDFQGRSNRFDYLTFIIFATLASRLGHRADFDLGFIQQFGPLTRVVNMLLLVPLLSITVRRLHDQNVSGYPALALLVMFTCMSLYDTTYGIHDQGALILVKTIADAASIFIGLTILFCLFSGDKAANRFGPARESPEPAAPHPVTEAP